MIPYGRQWIEDVDIKAVNDVLTSDFLTQGQRVKDFEDELASYVGANYSTVCNSATSALHAACLALGVNKQSLVWTSGISFVASANCAKYCGADVDFVDVELSTGNMSAVSLREQLEYAEKINKLPDVIIPVHYSGIPCDMAEIHHLSLKYGFKIIEDASHALGSEYDNAKTGSCKYSSICIFSFHPVKMITTGEGGALTTNDSDIAVKVEQLISHGITKNPLEFVGEATELWTSEPWAYEQQSLGYNYRMTDIQAALGSSQLTRLDSWVTRRNELMVQYKYATKDLPIHWLEVSKNKLASFHLAVIKISSDRRRALFDYMRENNIACQVHYIPIFRQPFYKELNIQNPNSDRFYEEVLSIPLFPKMTDAEQKEVIVALKGFFK